MISEFYLLLVPSSVNEIEYLVNSICKVLNLISYSKCTRLTLSSKFDNAVDVLTVKTENSKTSNKYQRYVQNNHDLICFKYVKKKKKKKKSPKNAKKREKKSPTNKQTKLEKETN